MNDNLDHPQEYKRQGDFLTGVCCCDRDGITTSKIVGCFSGNCHLQEPTWPSMADTLGVASTRVLDAFESCFPESP